MGLDVTLLVTLIERQDCSTIRSLLTEASNLELYGPPRCERNRGTPHRSWSVSNGASVDEDIKDPEESSWQLWPRQWVNPRQVRDFAKSPGSGPKCWRTSVIAGELGMRSRALGAILPQIGRYGLGEDICPRLEASWRADGSEDPCMSFCAFPARCLLRYLPDGHAVAALRTQLLRALGGRTGGQSSQPCTA